MHDMEEPSVASLAGLDQWLARTWTSAPTDYQWLLLQTLVTAASRRSWIASWPAVERGLILDLGCGPGIVAQEIAALLRCRVVGWDKDHAVLDMAQGINRLFNSDDRVRFRMGDILEDLGTREADAVTARFVAQYIGDLPGFFSTMKSHVKPGGYIALEDVDDGYLIEYPKPPDAWQRAVSAFQRYQSGPEGDRFVGRKLAQAGVESGLQLTQLALNPAVQAGLMEAQDLSVQFDIDRIDRAVPAMIQQHLITEDEWFQARAAYRASFPHYTYVSTATVRLVFRVP